VAGGTAAAAAAPQQLVMAYDSFLKILREQAENAAKAKAAATAAPAGKGAKRAAVAAKAPPRAVAKVEFVSDTKLLVTFDSANVDILSQLEKASGLPGINAVSVFLPPVTHLRFSSTVRAQP